MFDIVQSETFERWLGGLARRSHQSQDCGSLAPCVAGQPWRREAHCDGLSEMRIDEGPGYRVYFMRRGAVLIVLLCGGDKATQAADIDKAKALAADWKE